MEEIKTRSNDDAKTAWLNIVKKHRAKQKGLSPFCSLEEDTSANYSLKEAKRKKKTYHVNTDAGNVEHNINMFNMMNDVPSDIDINPMNGSVEVGGMSESFLDNIPVSDKIVLSYQRLPVDVLVSQGNPTGYYDTTIGGWLPDYDEYDTIEIQYDYLVPEEDVIDFILNTDSIMKDFAHLTDEEFTQYVNNNIDDLVIKYNEDILDEFEEKASKQAAKEYAQQDNYYYESVQKSELDDKFDMSTRSIL